MSKVEETRREVDALSRELSAKQHENLKKKHAIDSYNPVKEENDTRSRLAWTFVRSYFMLLAFILISVPLYNYLVFTETGDLSLNLPLQDLLLTYSSIVGPILGFVVGYYFKSKGD